MMPERQCRLKCVAYLPAIPGNAVSGAFLVVPLRKFSQGFFVEKDFDFGVLVFAFEPVHDVVPHFLGGLEVNVGVAEGDVNTGLKGFVYDTGPVGRQEENTGVVLQLAEEDCILINFRYINRSI
jgi:hypothetical protein